MEQAIQLITQRINKLITEQNIQYMGGDYYDELSVRINELENLLDELRNIFNKNATLNIPVVNACTFRFADWINGKYVDEIFKAKDREDAIRIMNEKYPNHEFALAQELF